MFLLIFFIGCNISTRGKVNARGSNRIKPGCSDLLNNAAIIGVLSLSIYIPIHLFGCPPDFMSRFYR